MARLYILKFHLHLVPSWTFLRLVYKSNAIDVATIFDFDSLWTGLYWSIIVSTGAFGSSSIIVNTTFSLDFIANLDPSTVDLCLDLFFNTI